jgi:hypothetical protein
MQHHPVVAIPHKPYSFVKKKSIKKSKQKSATCDVSYTLGTGKVRS